MDSGSLRSIGIRHIQVGERRRQDMGDIPALAESIEQVGLLHPIVVDAEFRLVAGARRLAALKHLGKELAPCLVVDRFSAAMAALRAEEAENTCRKPLTPSEAIAMANALEAIEKPKTAPRTKPKDRANGGIGGSGQKRESGTDSPQEEVKGDSQAAARASDLAEEPVGTDRRTLDRVRRVRHAADSITSAGGAESTGNASTAPHRAKAPTEPAEVALDQEKQKLPPELLPAFQNAQRIDRALALLAQFVREISPLLGNPKDDEPAIAGGYWMAANRQEILGQIGALRGTLANCRPHAICPHKHGKAVCGACKGQGWVVRTVWKNAPKD